MEPNKRPQSRQKNVTGGSGDIHKRGTGLGTGPVGSKTPASSGGKGVKRAAAGGGGGLAVIIAIVLMLLNKGGGLGSPSDSGVGGIPANHESSIAPGAMTNSNTLDDSVADGSREKRTQILGNNNDVVTLMIYMCGTDLESKHGMASSDIEEMRNACSSFGDNFNVIVYTGGCNGWKNGISSSVNQIYQIGRGEVKCLEKDAGNGAMTNPNTLSDFINYCKEKFPANRNELILWDHGGGSVSGYGYDEKNKNSGSMNLAGINKALNDGGVKFDFIGFDACLMATAENALMLDKHADYLIASEETEPGIGWYYTDWLKKFAENTSQPTLDIGKNIIDGFISECNRKCQGQKTTLSIIDLAEFANTVPENLADFSKSVSKKIKNEEYKDISDARYSTREFASSSKIDQVDLVDLAQKMGTTEGKKLGEALKNAVKYNRTSSNMTNAYGVSIYFPYKRTSYVDSACSTYQQIGMDDEYSKCIREFAGLETSGQISAGGTGSPLGSLFGLGDTGSSGGSADVIGSLLSAFLGGGDRSVAGLDSSNTSFMNDVDTGFASDYISSNYFDSSNLIWSENNGEYTMELPDKQWDLVQSIDKNMFYYDGSGYINLGLDNLFDYDEEGRLVADTDKDWVAVNGQVVAYYHTDTVENEDGTLVYMGYIPAFLNGERVELNVEFSGNYGYITGASTDYHSGETTTAAKVITEINEGDQIDFICDYYSDDMQYLDTYYLGDTITYSDNMKLSNVEIESGNVKIMYCFTDIYAREYWTESIDK